MAVEILRMPAGAGKTEVALEQLSTLLTEQPFAAAWVLVSGRRQEDSFRQRLIERGQQVYFNIEFFSFYQLYHRLLNIAGLPPRQLDEAARFALLRVVVEQLQNRLQVYDSIATTPGFIRIMADLIYELKQNLVTPEDFSAAARQPKDHDLALIYAAYQQRLIQYKLVDREGEGWLALSLVEDQPRYKAIGRNVDLLVVDGFDHFTRLQAQLLMRLAERVQHSLILLPLLPGGELTAGRRFERALEELQQVARVPITLAEADALIVGQRHADLYHLCEQIFRPGATTVAANGDLHLIEAADVKREAATVLRQVKRLLLAGCAPDDILIALRDWPRYAPHFTAYGEAYELPLALHGGAPLAQNPAVMLLLNLLRLHQNDFRRRDLLDVLRATYFDVPGLDDEQIQVLEQISQVYLVVGGRANWLRAIRLAGQGAPTTGEDEDPGEPLLSFEQASDLYERLLAFFKAVTPPAEAMPADYVRWIDNLIGPDADEDLDEDTADPLTTGYTFRMPQRIKTGTAMDSRDVAAVQDFKLALRSLLSAQALLDVVGEPRVIDATTFLNELDTVIANRAVQRAPLRSGRVLITTVTDARGLPHRHVFIPGLSEGIFPVPLAEDPLYLDSERLALREHQVLLETQAERAGDDGLFYELISLASESLTLSRPTVQDGIPWAASHLWREVESLFSGLDAFTHTIPVGAVVDAANAACTSEALLAVAGDLIQPQADYPGIYNWLLSAYGEPWGRMNQARAVELRRFSHRQAHDHYSGRLSQPDMIAYAADALGPQRLWSASQLNDYGICGFRFFAKRLLKLEALEEPEEGLDAQKLGTLNHEILERTYREIGVRGLTIIPDHLDDALAILRREIAVALPSAPARLGFTENALWEQERESLMRRLEALVRLDFSEKNPLQKITSGERLPFLLEAPFGSDGAVEVHIPILIDGQEEALRVRGYIDRMDASGNGVIVIDYKTGSSRIPVDDMREGRNFQMMVYLRAAETILMNQTATDVPKQVLGGLFWHIRNQNSSGEIRLAEDEMREALEQAEGHIGTYIAAGRKGDFTVKPRKMNKGQCVHYCEYARLCRVRSTSQYKDQA